MFIHLPLYSISKQQYLLFQHSWHAFLAMKHHACFCLCMFVSSINKVNDWVIAMYFSNFITNPLYTQVHFLMLTAITAYNCINILEVPCLFEKLCRNNYAPNIFRFKFDDLLSRRKLQCTFPKHFVNLTSDLKF